MIIILTMKNKEIIKVKTDKDFISYSRHLLETHNEWKQVTRENGTKAIFRIEDLKYITHE
jgi:hypothetical protein